MKFGRMLEHLDRWLEHVHQDVEYEAVEVDSDDDSTDDKHQSWLRD